MGFNRYLSYLTRRLPPVWGVGRIVEALRTYYTKKYSNRNDSTVIINDYDGNLKMRLDRAAYMGGTIYWMGSHHRRELAYLSSICRPDMTFVDVGANMGEFTLFMAKRLSKGSVIAFEPTKRMFEILQQNVKLNEFNNVKLFNIALGDRESKMPIYTSSENIEHEVWNEGLFRLFPNENVNVLLEEIMVVPFDKIAKENNIQNVNIIKIDVEGAELYVLKGLEQVLKLFKPKLLIEISREAFANAGYTVTDISNYIKDYGYTTYGFNANNKLYQIDIEEESNKSTWFNVFCQ
ncbi:MAG: FkbM family methyltransferase [Smithella sp.]|jgi:FkbM family methyltransferase